MRVGREAPAERAGRHVNIRVAQTHSHAVDARRRTSAPRVTFGGKYMRDPRTFVFFVLCVVAPSAVAAPHGWYVAIDGGQSHYTGIVGASRQWLSITPLPPQGMVVVSSQASLQRSGSNDTGYRLIVGYQFNRYFGVEGGFSNFGQVQGDGSGSVVMAPVAGILPLEVIATYADSVKLRVRGWELAGTLSWPLSQRWSLFGRAGIFDSHTELEVASTPAPPISGGLISKSISVSNSKWVPTYGVGVNFSPADHWALRLGWNRYAHLGDRDTTGRFNVNLLSLGVAYAF